MAGQRIVINLFIPDTPAGVLFNGTRIPAALANKLNEIRQGIKFLQSFSVNPNLHEEMKSTYHKCYHNEIPQKPCESEQKI